MQISKRSSRLSNLSVSNHLLITTYCNVKLWVRSLPSKADYPSNRNAFQEFFYAKKKTSLNYTKRERGPHFLTCQRPCWNTELLAEIWSQNCCWNFIRNRSLQPSCLVQNRSTIFDNARSLFWGVPRRFDTLYRIVFFLGTDTGGSPQAPYSEISLIMKFL